MMRLRSPAERTRWLYLGKAMGGIATEAAGAGGKVTDIVPGGAGTGTTSVPCALGTGTTRRPGAAGGVAMTSVGNATAGTTAGLTP